MRDVEFAELLEARLAATRKVLGSKAAEYAGPDDRLHNFKRAASITGETPAEACVGMFAKHLVSVLDLVEDAKNNQRGRMGLLDEKIGDAVNYLILLEALLKE